MAILNGRLDVATLAAVPGGLLRADAAAAWIQVRAAAGLDLRPTSWADTYRSYAVQERIFRERYTTSYVTGIDPRRWLGRTWWRLPGTASAAVPGTSNHGLGVAIDVTALGGFAGTNYGRLAAVAPAHGWSNRAGRTINEPWHWEYTPSADTHPTPTQEDDMPLDQSDIDRIKTDAVFPAVYNLLKEPEILGVLAKAVWAHKVAGSDGIGVDAYVWLRDTRVIVGKLTAPGAIAAISDADLARVAQACANEADRRAYARLSD